MSPERMGGPGQPLHMMPRGEWFGQPRGLTILFLTEMWEKFSFFGMRALLVYYMTKQLRFDQQGASLIYGAYAACAYLTPIAGGYIADRWLNARRAVLIGGAIMALGHFVMASERLFFPALVLIALGNGLFLPNLPSQIRGLYAEPDPRRVSAYNVYYMGVNLGALIAPLICGTLGEVYGWHYGFGAAGVGMVVGLCIYTGGRRFLPEQQDRPAARSTITALTTMPREDLVRRVLLLSAIAVAVIIFRCAYEQLGNTVAVWIDERVDRHVIGQWVIPATWFQSLDSAFVLLLTPLLVAHWNRRARDGKESTPLLRMALGAGLVAVSYALLAAILGIKENGTVSWLCPVLFIFLLTTGELFILPTGLGLFGQLAPAGLGATVVALWFLGSFGGNLLAGVVGSLWSRLHPSSFFALMAGIAGLAGMMLVWIARCSLTQARSAAGKWPTTERL